MSHSEKPLMMVLPVGWQSIYFIVIAFACYMGLDALGVSLSYLVSYPVTTERLLLSYGGLVLLAICIFFKSPHRFYKHHNILIIVLLLLGLSALILYQFNDSIYLFKESFKTDTPYFIALHGFIALSFYIWIVFFAMAYYASGSPVKSVSIKSVYLTIVFAPVLTYMIYIVMTVGFIFTFILLDAKLHGWPLWYLCFIFSFAILVSSNLIALLTTWAEARPKAYVILLSFGIIVSLLFFAYLNYEQVFQNHLISLYFNYPDFIQ